MDEGLEALMSADFHWTSPLESIWRTPLHHVPELHQPYKQRVIDDVRRLQHEPDHKPLGRIIAGSPGAGKTQILAELCQWARQQQVFFVLIDMADVKEFWETVLLGILDSLQRRGSGQRQFDRIFDYLLALTAPPDQPAASPGELMACLSMARRHELCQHSLQVLAKAQHAQTHAHQDVIRALFLLAADDFSVSDIGYTWLQGLDISVEDAKTIGLRQTRSDPRSVIRGLSWLMSLIAPSILAFDQLDPIVSELNIEAQIRQTAQNRTRQQRASAIIEAMASGLMGLWDMTLRSMLLLSCTDTTWATLEQRALRSATARFHRPLFLQRIPNAQIAESIVINRLRPAYAHQAFTPPYPSYPFKPAIFTQAQDYFPRDLLKACDLHREYCAQHGSVLEIEEFQATMGQHLQQPTHRPTSLTERFQTLRAQAELDALMHTEADDGLLMELIPAFCEALTHEVIWPEGIEVDIEKDFHSQSHYPPLHARIRLLYQHEGDREYHFSVRALQKTHPTAFQSRLKAAMTAAGIDRELPFRQLLILRTTVLPSGPATRRHLHAFIQAGGVLHQPKEDELRTLWAVAQLVKEHPPRLSAWLSEHRPLSTLPMARKWQPLAMRKGL